MVSMHQAGLNNQGFGMLPHMPDRSSVPEVGEFLREQEELRLALIADLRRSQEFAPYVSEQQLWTNYKLIEVFDQLAQILCNRYPLNSPERKNGPPTVLKHVPVAPGDGEAPLAYVRRLLEAFHAPALPGLPPLHGGAVGFIGYDCVRELEHLPDAPEDDLGLPDLALLLTRTFVVFDHLLQKAFVITNVLPVPGPTTSPRPPRDWGSR